MSLIGKLLPAASALLVAAGSLGAQGASARPAAPVCDADASKGNLAKAAFSIEQARGKQGTPAAATQLASAVKLLEAAKGEDPTAQALFMGQTLAFWLSQPNTPLTPKRGTLGFTQNPEATIDLIGAVDSLFRIVETAKPNCAELTSAYRGGLPGYLTLVNGAINALNAEQLDSAEFYATQANRLYASSPYGTMVLGSVASKRKDDARALEFWAQAAAAAAKDSLYRDVERQVLSNQGTLLVNTATIKQGAERTAAARRAAEVYTRLLALPGTSGLYASSGRANLQSALLLLGDTAAVIASYQPLLANPAAYGFQDLLGSAVTAARVNRTPDATRMFEAVLVQNPYNRDALFNTAVVYLDLGQNEKVTPLVTRLVAVDPANPENYNLAARAYLAMAKTAKNAKRSALEKAYNDTTMAWYGRGNALPAEVVVNEFNVGDKQLVLSGTVLDRRDKIDGGAATAAAPARGARAKAAAKPAAKPAVPARAVTLQIEALDKAGAVLGTTTVTTEPLTPGRSAPFRATIDAANAAAYRYTIGS